MSDREQLLELLGLLCNGALPAEQATELRARLMADTEARLLYLDYVDVHCRLVESARREASSEALDALQGSTADGIDVDEAINTLDGPRSGARAERRKRVLPIVATAATAAAVVFGVGLYGGWGLLGVDRGEQSPARSSSDANNRVSAGPSVGAQNLYVAQFTNLTPDVVWGESAKTQEFLLRVRRGDRVEIDKGLVQIDYYSGAKLILHGPCVFVPTGESSGRLESGRLTGNVSVGDFLLTTPTARVIDLGTEFGVSVNGIEETNVCVFDGEVKVESALCGEARDEGLMLTEGMAARVARQGNVAPLSGFSVEGFKRSLPGRSSSEAPDDGVVSLVELMASAHDGSTRLAGVIAPDTGDSDRHPWLRTDGPGYSLASGYRRTDWHPYVDGVFIPTESGRQTIVDSAGGVADLPASTGRTWGPIWSRKKIGGKAAVSSQHDYWGTDTLEVVARRLGDCRTGMIGIHSNVGVTFDLGALRDRLSGSPESFQTAVCNLDNSRTRLPEWSAGYRLTADVRIFVDGELRKSVIDFARSSGDLAVEVALSASDRFLTVVCTDASDQDRDLPTGLDAYDHVVLIDPVLRLAD
ncbi:MAG: hypothetical protein AAGJ46_08505 [Planctomycetota bacterium]